jgi:hypothetical protein
MPPILAQMHGYSVRPANVRLDGGPDGFRLVGLARLTDARHVVDIDTQFNHGSCSQCIMYSCTFRGNTHLIDEIYAALCSNKTNSFYSVKQVKSHHLLPL